MPVPWLGLTFEMPLSGNGGRQGMPARGRVVAVSRAKRWRRAGRNAAIEGDSGPHRRSVGPHVGRQLPRPARQSTGSADIPATDEKGWDRRRERTAARQRILIKLQIYFKTEGVI